MPPLQEALVPSLVRELRSHKLQVWPKKKKSRDLRFVPSRHHSAQPGHEMLDKYGMNLEFTRSLVPALVPVDVGNAEMESDWGSALTCS